MGGLGLDVSIDHKSHGLQLAIIITETELLCLGQSKDKYESFIQVVPGNNRAAIKASKSCMIKALDCFFDCFRLFRTL